MSGKCSVYKSRPINSMALTTEQNEAQARMIARTCPSYGTTDQVADLNATRFGTEVCLPIVSVDPDEISTYKQAGVDSCTMCEHYVKPSNLVQASFAPTNVLNVGRGMGLCAARGTVIHDVTCAVVCDMRSKGASAGFDTTLLGMAKMFPEYSRAAIDKFRTDASRAAGRISVLPENFEPSTYSSGNIPQEYYEMGIRAWVPLSDPSGTGNVVQLPVFRRDFFSEEDQALIPNTNDEEHPELYVDHGGVTYDVAVAWSELDETPAAWGAPGLGKTELARQMAWIMQLPFVRISITGTSELDDLEGKMMFLDGETKFQEGRVVKGWKRPCVMLIDEPNVGPREVWQFLRPLTDNSKQLVVDADSGRPVSRDPFCYLMFAMNPAWDMRNDGTNDLADADIRRLFHVEMTLPPRDLEMSIIRARCALDGFTIPENLLKMVMDISTGIRKSSDNHDLPISWGIGTQIKVARYLNWFDPIRAYRLAAADSLDPDVRDLVLNEVRTHYTPGVV